MASNEITHRGSADVGSARGSPTAERTTESGSGDGGVSVRATDVESVAGPAESQYRLLVPVPRGDDIDELERIVRTAAPIARHREGDLLLLCLVDVPRQTPYEAITPDLPRVEEVHEAAERLLGAAKRMDVRANTIVVLTHQETRSIVDATARHDCDGVFMPVDGDRSQRWRLLGSAAVETVVSRADADVFVEKVGTRETSIDRILLAVSDGPHSERATETARTLALESGARVDVIHVLDENPTADERQEGNRLLRAAERRLDDVDRVDTHLITGKDVAAGIVARSDAYDVTVLGAPTVGLLEQFAFGTVPDSVIGQIENTVLMTKHRTDNSSMYHRWIAGDTGEEIEANE